ncbi:MAG: RNA methyltransferase [Prevotellaceae bacterium]|jgi:TrmH family RNA methyltransferase|nr:RNA methyltransferase [Prevotellaceae bacterium]
MISKSDISLITSLAHKKYRDELGLFVVEGPKMVEEVQLSGYTIHKLFTDAELTPAEMKKISGFKTPSSALAVVRQPKHQLNIADMSGDLLLALDGVQDPGNLGTIIRLADWFGIRHIVCSQTSADCYNSKVVQATMGAIFRVKIYYYTSLADFCEQMAGKIPIYGTALDGDNIYEKPLITPSILVMGSEGSGISPEVAAWLSNKLYIPSYPAENRGSESLNVAVSTAIVCAEFRRKI